jgi:palmitoyl-protein thioesterase
MLWVNHLSIVIVLLLVIAPAASSRDKVCKTEKLRADHPVLCHMLDRLAIDPHGLALEMHDWAKSNNLLVGLDLDVNKNSASSGSSSKLLSSEQLPVVFAHGMGDSCFNRGMQDITEHTGELLNGVYATCIPTGKTASEDTSNGYFLNMDASVDIFAANVKADAQLQNGFHAIGFSQGNNVIRGYIAKYNDPPVDSFLSVNGVNAGEGAVPYCRPSGSEKEKEQLEVGERLTGMCDLLMEQASRRAYTEWAQEHSFQANYWRDPRPVERDAYAQYCQLAQWNNEGRQFNQTLKDNYAKTNKFVWILAEQDGMVFPKEGRQH